MAPDIIIEAKSLNVVLEEHVGHLQRYVDAVPLMRRGVAVLTNGREWWLYDPTEEGPSRGNALTPSTSWRAT